MTKVFVNYRNGDEPFGAILIHLFLANVLGDENVFRSSSSIRPGDDFVEHITAAIQHCDVFLSVIGCRWMSVTDRDGRPRIRNAGDWVLRELSMAFDERKRVVPVLLGGATMPRSADLPPEIAALSRCQYRRLDPRQFLGDMALLCSDVRALAY